MKNLQIFPDKYLNLNGKIKRTLKYDENIYTIKNYNNGEDCKFKIYENCDISHCIRRGFRWEEHQHDLIDKYVKKDDICLEVGSHIGTISVKLSKNCKQLYCFEPLITSYNLLKQNLEMNNCKNVILKILVFQMKIKKLI